MGKENDMAGTIGKCLNITQGKNALKAMQEKRYWPQRMPIS